MAAREDLSIAVRLRDFASGGFKKILGAASSFTRNMISRVGSIAKSFLSLRGLIAGVAGGFGAVKALQFAGELEDISNAFTNLTSKFSGAEKTLAALREGTKGTVSDFQLMKTANEALLFGVAKTDDEFKELANVARRLAKATGEDATKAFSDLTLGIARQSRQILDNLKIIIDTESAYEKYATSINKSKNELTDADKKQAFLNATLDSARKKIAELGPDVETLSEVWSQFKTEAANTGAEILRSVTPAIKEGLTSLVAFIRENKDVVFDFLADVVEAVKDFLAQIGEGIEFVLTPILRLKKLLNETQSTVKLGLLEVAEAFDKNGETAKQYRSELEVLATEFVDLDNIIKDLSEDRLEGFGKGADAVVGKLRGMAQAARDAQAASEFVGPIAPPEFAGGVDRRFGLSLLNRQEPKQETGGIGFGGALESLKGFGESGVQRLNEGFTMMGQTLRDDVGPAIVQMAEDGKKLTEDERLRTLNEEIVPGLGEGFRLLQEESKAWGAAATQAVLAISDSMASNITSGFMSMIDGSKSAKEAFKDMAKGILSDIAAIIIKMLILKAIQASLGGLGGAVTAEKGGVLPGGFQALASGGVVTKPTLGLVGEGRNNEAVIPLPDNRSVPVKMFGGEGGGGGTVVNQTNNFQLSGTESEARMLERNKATIVGFVVEANNQSLSTRDGLR